MTMHVEKIGYVMQVRTVDGVPQCPCHGEPMVEVQPDAWQCADDKALCDYIRAELTVLLDDALDKGAS